jgi:hypothetical protein
LTIQLQVTGRRWQKARQALAQNCILGIIKKRYITTAPILSQILRNMTFTGLWTTTRVDFGTATRSMSAAGFAPSMIQEVMCYVLPLVYCMHAVVLHIVLDGGCFVSLLLQ